jgi:photosystem II stability/assembly factor-like uncharacterized protein
MKTARSSVTRAICAVFVAAMAMHAPGAEPDATTKPGDTGVVPGAVGKWVSITKAVADVAGPVQKLGVTAVNVDPATGDLYVGYGHAGIWKSTDHGQTFKLSDGGRFNAMGVNSYSCDADPEGGRLVFWGMYGRSMITLDGGKTWAVAGDGHHDWGATDWSDPAARTMWVCPHGGNVISFDAGKTWDKKAEDKITGFGLFDSKTFAGLLVDAVFVSTDGAGDFAKKTRKIAPANETCMKVYKGVGYWISPQGILVSKDKGQTWQVRGTPLKDPIAGPFFGENANHMIVVTKASFLETIDGGQTWTAVAPALGDGHWDTDKGETTWCRYFAWDARNNILYGGKLHDSAMRFVLPEKKVAAATAPKDEAAPTPLVFDKKPDKLATSTALDRKVLWDGDRAFPKAFGYADPKDKNSFGPQTDEVHLGKVALELRIAASPSSEGGKAVAWGGWNWHGWWPGDSGDDLTKYTHLVFWVKVAKGKKIDGMKAGLASSAPAGRSVMVDVAKYCKNALDGEWREVAIPAGDLMAEGAKFNPRKAWELEIECRIEPSQVPYSVFIDDLAFEKRPAATSGPDAKP